MRRQSTGTTEAPFFFGLRGLGTGLPGGIVGDGGSRNPKYGIPDLDNVWSGDGGGNGLHLHAVLHAFAGTDPGNIDAIVQRLTP